MTTVSDVIAIGRIIKKYVKPWLTRKPKKKTPVYIIELNKANTDPLYLFNFINGSPVMKSLFRNRLFIYMKEDIENTDEMFLDVPIALVSEILIEEPVFDPENDYNVIGDEVSVTAKISPLEGHEALLESLIGNQYVSFVPRGKFIEANKQIVTGWVVVFKD